MSSKIKENESPQENLNTLDWIALRKDMDTVLQTETFTGKMKRKFSENPFVPIGQFSDFYYSFSKYLK